MCIADIEKIAKTKLGGVVLDYYQQGSDDEFTVQENAAAFRRWRIRPKFLRDVSRRNLHTTLLGQEVNVPIGISPSGILGLVHPDGEIALAKSACKRGVCMTLSSHSNFSGRQVAAAVPNGLKWFQLYVNKDPTFTRNLVEYAEKHGFKALALTVDLPVLSRRRGTLRSELHLPPHIHMGNIADNFHKPYKKENILYVEEIQTDPKFSWKDVKDLQKRTPLPIILKGIMTAEDAIMAVEHGIQGIWVSNHGGRQLNDVPATIDVLPEIVAAVNGRAEIYLDSGVTQGTDVFKALALGAKAAFVGRAAVWGLALAGEAGATKVLDLLIDELDTAMALAGCQDLSDISRSMVVHESEIAKL